jgi:hypothetical protein
MITYNTESLVLAVKRKAQLPSSGNPLFSDQDIIDFANEEMSSGVVPQLLSVRENYFAVTETVSLVSGQSTLRIPQRAIGMQLIDVWFVATDGTTTPLAYVDYGRSPLLMAQQATTNQPKAYALLGNDLVLFPNIDASDGFLKLTYSAAPGLLVPTVNCSQIISVSTATNTVEITTDPAVISVSSNTRIDLIRGTSGYNTVMINELVAATGAISITTTNALSPLLQVGDWVALTNQSPYPQIPAELHPILLQRVVVKLLEAMADPRLETAQGKLQEIEAKAYTMIADRIKDKSMKLMNVNSPMRRQSWRWL